MRLHQTKKLLHSKGNNQQSGDTTYRIGDNNCELFIWQGIHVQNRETQKFNSKNPNNCIKI
jgi:hypothetical protein